MKDMFVSLLIVAAILAVCGLYFKAVIMNWLSRDAELRALNDIPLEEPFPAAPRTEVRSPGPEVASHQAAPAPA